MSRYQGIAAVCILCGGYEGSTFMATKDNAGKSAVANGRGKWNVPTGRRTDEWSEALVLVGESQDRAAFTRFFRHFAPLIKAFALSGSSLSATHADELVQEVMLKVWQKAGGFNPEKAAASTWVYTIARNCRTDMFRRLQKFDTALASDDFELESEEEESFVVLHTRRGAERVRELLGDLPPDQAQILGKVYMEGKSHSEAAAELDLPLGTVKSRVRLAIQKLQGLMEA
ncbi:MAG: sigma-70 family RNA polymerase sigma factor [Luminiphilus sp.]|nr:sigma-70 family RNA polymerase sigma factor [Luminiphilus sp.]